MLYPCIHHHEQILSPTKALYKYPLSPTSKPALKRKHSTPSLRKKSQKMDNYALHLTVAALVGASVVAVSAYVIHRKALAQILDFARAAAVDRDDGRHLPPARPGRRGARRKAAPAAPGQYPRTWASSSDVAAVAGGGGEDRANGGLPPPDDAGLPIPPGLPRLHTISEGIREVRV